MARFFINRWIVAIVIAILTVMIGLISMPGLAEIMVDQALATPIGQQMSDVDNMNYMSAATVIAMVLIPCCLMWWKPWPNPNRKQRRRQA